MTTIASFLTPEDEHLSRLYIEYRWIEGFLLDEYVVQSNQFG